MKHSLAKTPCGWARAILTSIILCDRDHIDPRPDKPPDIVAHVCGDPLSRYTCPAARVAADFLRILRFSRYRTTPPPLTVAPVALQLPRVSHVKLPLKRCCAAGGVQQLHLWVSRCTVQLCPPDISCSQLLWRISGSDFEIA